MAFVQFQSLRKFPMSVFEAGKAPLEDEVNLISNQVTTLPPGD